MTKEEALRLLKTQRIDGDDLHEAFDLAVKALEAQKTDDLIVLQLDCLVGRGEFLAIRNQVVDQVEEGVVLLPNYMHVAYIGSKCNVEVMYEGEGGTEG